MDPAKIHPGMTNPSSAVALKSILKKIYTLSLSTEYVRLLGDVYSPVTELSVN
jgi:hypothetical protein